VSLRRITHAELVDLVAHPPETMSTILARVLANLGHQEHDRSSRIRELELEWLSSSANVTTYTSVRLGGFWSRRN
jgi:hypothetical protein